MKTYSMTGLALQYAVALALDLNPKAYKNEKGAYLVTDRRANTPLLITAGDIQDKHRISAEVGHDGIWIAYNLYNYADERRNMQGGRTREEAVFRCLVDMKIGLQVDIPLELEA